MQKSILVILLLSITLTGLLPEAFAQETSPAASETQPVPLQKKYEKQITTLANRLVVKKAFQTIIQLEPETRRDH